MDEESEDGVHDWLPLDTLGYLYQTTFFGSW